MTYLFDKRPSLDDEWTTLETLDFTIHTDIFIFRFVSLLCLRSTLRLLHCIHKDVFFPSIYLLQRIKLKSMVVYPIPTMFVLIFQKYKTWLQIG